MRGLDRRQITAQLPGRYLRTYNGVSHRFTTMKAEGRLTNNWGLNIGPYDTTPYSLEEDMELMEWHCMGRKGFDVGTFDKNRSAKGMRRRLDWLLRYRNQVRVAESLQSEMQREFEEAMWQEEIAAGRMSPFSNSDSD